MISILVSIIGFAIIKYEFQEIFRDFGLKKVFFNPTLFFLSVMLLIITKKYFFEPLWVWFFVVLIFFFVYFFPFFLKLKLEAEIKENILTFLDNIILNLQMGLSLRAASVKASEEFVGWKRTQFQLLVNGMFWGQKKELFLSKSLKKLHDEIQKIEITKTKILEQLKSYREQQKMEQNLRHRSRQITMNLKIQSIVMTILYFLIGIFIFSNFETAHSKKILFLSVFFFSVGHFLVFLISRRFKWKT